MKVNDVIGKIIPAQQSVDGRTVIGELLIAEQIEVSKPVLEGVRKQWDGTLRVTKDGILLTNGLSYKVSACLEIEGDLCQKTGNIQSDKSVNVHGFVEPGIVLETKGDAIIQKNVENATVSAEGSVIIKSGTRGTQCKIIAGGNISASFAGNTELNAKGDIRIINSVINCHTVCQGIVYIGDAHSMKSSIVGNITHAYKGIESAIIGSDSFKKTIIIAGAGVEVIKQLMDTTDELKKIKITLDGLERYIRNIVIIQSFKKNKKSHS